MFYYLAVVVFAQGGGGGLGEGVFSSKSFDRDRSFEKIFFSSLLSVLSKSTNKLIPCRHYNQAIGKTNQSIL